MQKCSKCKMKLDKIEFKLVYSGYSTICKYCCREISNKNNKAMRKKIKDASFGCWWVEIFNSHPIKNKHE